MHMKTYIVVPADLRVLSVELLDERLGVTVAAV